MNFESALTALLLLAVAAGAVFMLRSGQVRGVAGMTFAEGVRMRIVLVFVIILVFLVISMPSALKGESTVAHRLQTFLTWSLTFLGLFMGLATIFFSCATLSQEFRNKTMHMVVVKPVTRFEVLAGKWLGVNLLNLLMVAICGLAIYGFAYVIRNQTEEFSRDRVMVNDAIWSARVAARPKMPDFLPEANAYVADLLKREGAAVLDPDAALRQRVNDLAEEWHRVRPGWARRYEFEGLPAPDQKTSAFQIRFKARSVPLSGDEMVNIIWSVFDPRTNAEVWRFPTQRRNGEMHQFLLGKAAIHDGKAAIGVINPADPFSTAPVAPTILFEGAESLELLYKVGSFETNFVKTLILILCILAFLSAVGLFFATFATFPVAAFCTLSIALFCIGSPWWVEVIGGDLTANLEGGKIDPFGALGPYVRPILMFVLKVGLPDFGKYSGIDSLTEGYAIEMGRFLSSATHTLVYGAVLLVLPGWLIFQRREVAEVIV